MRAPNVIFDSLRNKQGAVAIMVAVLTAAVFFGLAALSVDVSHLTVVKNELQNAADAGALAGARVLYSADGKDFNANAGQTAEAAAEANNSDKKAVVANWNGNASDNDDIQIGHWSFTHANDNDSNTLAFTRYTGDLATYLAPNLHDYTTEQLDTMSGGVFLINAVKVTAHNPDATSFFAKLLGHNSFNYQADAVAYLGFAGKFEPGYFDQPIVICSKAILDAGDNLTCTIGRMINSGADASTSNTGGWSNFSQPCSTANSNEMRDLVCAQGNPNPIDLDGEIGATGGEEQTVFDELRDCWLDNNSLDTNSDGIPDKAWEMTLPVAECAGNNVSNCEPITSAVTVKLLWITEGGEDPHYTKVPRKMEDWNCTVVCDKNCTDEQNIQCWDDFVERFDLQNFDDGSPAPYQKKAIYFMPDCENSPPTGGSGGKNHGLLARSPVLVE